jgi:hypothetical protein
MTIRSVTVRNIDERLEMTGRAPARPSITV